MIERKVRQLINDIETGKVKLTKNLADNGFDYLSNHYGNVDFKTDTGWRLTVFFDCGDWDYFDNFVRPNGDVMSYDDFSSDIKNHRPTDEVAKTIYGSPGYLGRFLKND